MKTTKPVLLAYVLGATLALTGCETVNNAANSRTDFQKVAQEATEKGREMADKALVRGKDMTDTGLAMASEAFTSTLEITEASADGTKEQMNSGLATLEERFHSVKDKLDTPKREELQAKFAKIKTGMTELKDKTGMELISAINDLKKEGSALADEMKEVVGLNEVPESGGEATPVDGATPDSEAMKGTPNKEAVETTPETKATPQ